MLNAVRYYDQILTIIWRPY